VLRVWVAYQIHVLHKIKVGWDLNGQAFGARVLSSFGQVEPFLDVLSFVVYEIQSIAFD